MQTSRADQHARCRGSGQTYFQDPSSIRAAASSTAASEGEREKEKKKEKTQERNCVRVIGSLNDVAFCSKFSLREKEASGEAGSTEVELKTAAVVRERVEVVEGEAAERATALVLLFRIKRVLPRIELCALVCGATGKGLGERGCQPPLGEFSENRTRHPSGHT